MPIDRSDTDDERVARVDLMLEEFRTAQKRRLVRERNALSTGTEAAYPPAAVVEEVRVPKEPE
jgi:hypothetical protein